MPMLSKHFIGGDWVDSEGGSLHLVIDPATSKPRSEMVLGSTKDVDRAVLAARQAFAAWSGTGRDDRAALIQRIIVEVEARAEDLAQAMTSEMGVPISFSREAQVGAGLDNLRLVLPGLAGFPFEERHAGHVLVREPIGVVAMITPWNWPLNQITAKVAPALAAGCAMVLKPSEECPSVAAIFAEAMAAAGTPAGVFNLVQGDGAGAGSALSRHPDVDMVSFTGSTRAGIAVAKAAADTVKRVTQELGGNAANIILPGSDLAAVMPQALEGVLANSGQSCIAPTRLLVHRDEAEQAARIGAAVMNAVQVGHPARPGDHIGPLVNAAQFAQTQRLILRGLEEGAELAAGGLGRPEGLDQGFYVRPTLLSGVTNDMEVARAEIFGPVATIIVYDDLDEAVRIANDTEYGLSAVISGDPDVAAPLTRKLRAGSVLINAWAPDGTAPFGGFKRSGNGRELGAEGMREFMELKSVFGEPAAA